MDVCRPSKKIRLSAENNVNDDLWGEDLDVPEDLFQEIETQGYSQYQDVRLSSAVPRNAYSSQSSTVSYLHHVNGSNVVDLQSELQTKVGEIKYLRNQIDKCRSQITDKNTEITDLKKQLTGKDTEIELQKVASKAKLSNLNSTVVRLSPNRSISLQKRLPFADPKNNFKKYEVFNSSRKVNQGDRLHELLKSVLTDNDANVQIPPKPCRSAASEDISQPALFLDENDFIVLLKSSFLQLCWFNSFEDIHAHKLICFILDRCHELLTRVQHFLSREPTSDAAKGKPITLDRLEDTTTFSKSKDLLKHTKLSIDEKGIAARQTIIAVAKMIEVHPSIAEMIIESERYEASRLSCMDFDQVTEDKSNSDAISHTQNVDDHNLSENMEVDSSPSKGNRKILHKFDMIALTYDIVSEITVKHKADEYEGVLSSVLYLYSVLCSSDANIIYQKHEEIIINTIRKILFSLPSFAVIRDIVAFLSTSSHFSFSKSLCCRSAAETFSENFKCYNFTKETCMLQVLCVYIEMMKKIPRFVDDYTSWILSSISEPHEVQWVRNKTDSKFCECLSTLEQITIKIIFNCIEQYKDTELPKSSKLLLKSALSRCISIFQLLQCKDIDFQRNILPCRGEYWVMLRALEEIMADQKTKNFVYQECLRSGSEPKYDLAQEKRKELTESLEDLLKS